MARRLASHSSPLGATPTTLHLSDDGRRLVLAISRTRQGRLRIADMPRRFGWTPERASEALAALLADDWAFLEGEPPIVALTTWAHVWVADRVRVGDQPDANPADVPDRRYPDDEQHVVSSCANAWRELHALDCQCHLCRQEASGTKPRPRGDCPVCAEMPPGWVCARCMRNTSSKRAPVLPTFRSGVVKDGELKGGKG